MNLDELKQSMTTLDDVLAQKSSDTITLNTSTCDTAQKRIAKLYRKNILMCGVLAVVFLLTGIGGVNEEVFPSSLKFFLSIFLGISAIWYTYLYFKTKKINVLVDAPMKTMNKVASLRLFALIGEIVLAICLTMFFTLLLSHLWNLAHYKVWLIAGALFVALIYSGIVMRKTIRDFKNLTATE